MLLACRFCLFFGPLLFSLPFFARNSRMCGKVFGKVKNNPKTLTQIFGFFFKHVHSCFAFLTFGKIYFGSSFVIALVLWCDLACGCSLSGATFASFESQSTTDGTLCSTGASHRQNQLRIVHSSTQIPTQITNLNCKEETNVKNAAKHSTDPSTKNRYPQRALRCYRRSGEHRIQKKRNSLKTDAGVNELIASDLSAMPPTPKNGIPHTAAHSPSLALTRSPASCRLVFILWVLVHALHFLILALHFADCSCSLAVFLGASLHYWLLIFWPTESGATWMGDESHTPSTIVFWAPVREL